MVLYRVLISVMEIKGIPLENYIIKYLLFGENKALKVFNGLGGALRELHYSPLEGLHNGFFPNSYQEIRLEISNISRKLAALRVLSKKLMNTILDAVKETSSIDDEILTNVNLHGEFYFTHIILSKGRYVFLDFHNACKGLLLLRLSHVKHKPLRINYASVSQSNAINAINRRFFNRILRKTPK